MAVAGLDGEVYAEPLIVADRIIVATENDTVYALRATTGAIIWQTHLGTPVAGSSLPCGNVDPVGITSTPVVDAAAGRVYAVGMVQPARDVLFDLDLASGKLVASKPVDVAGADPKVHNQRSALSLSGGKVYIPYGGRFGDCGDYHGRVVSVSVSGTGLGVVTPYTLPTQRRRILDAAGSRDRGRRQSLPCQRQQLEQLDLRLRQQRRPTRRRVDARRLVGTTRLAAPQRERRRRRIVRPGAAARRTRLPNRQERHRIPPRRGTPRRCRGRAALRPRVHRQWRVGRDRVPRRHHVHPVQRQRRAGDGEGRHVQRGLEHRSLDSRPDDRDTHGGLDGSDANGHLTRSIPANGTMLPSLAIGGVPSRFVTPSAGNGLTFVASDQRVSAFGS